MWEVDIPDGETTVSDVATEVGDDHDGSKLSTHERRGKGGWPGILFYIWLV